MTGRLDAAVQPEPGTQLTTRSGHRFRRDEAGAWYCGCEPNPWIWLRVVEWTQRDPITTLEAPSHA